MTPLKIHAEIVNDTVLSFAKEKNKCILLEVFFSSLFILVICEISVPRNPTKIDMHVIVELKTSVMLLLDNKFFIKSFVIGILNKVKQIANAIIKIP